MTDSIKKTLIPAMENAIKAPEVTKVVHELGAIALDQPRLMIGIRHKMPLLLGHGPNATYLASDATRYTTGRDFVIDGGYTLF